MTTVRRPGIGFATELRVRAPRRGGAAAIASRPPRASVYSGLVDEPRNERGRREELVELQFHGEAEYWNDVYSSPGLEGRVYRDRHERVLRLLARAKLPKPARVLDIGCGAGMLTAALAERGDDVVAVDPVQRMVDLTRARIEEQSLAERVTVEVGDVYTLPLADASVDAAVAVGLLPWLRAPEHALAEIGRVVRPRGYLIVTTDNAARLSHVLDPRLSPYTEPLRRRVNALLHRDPQSSAEEIHSFTLPLDVDGLLEEAGFRKRASASAGFAPLSFWGRPYLRGRAGERLHASLQSLADRGVPPARSLGAHYIVLAQKS